MFRTKPVALGGLSRSANAKTRPLLVRPKVINISLDLSGNIYS